MCSRTTSEIPLKAGGRPKTCFDCPTRAAALTPGGRCLPALGVGLPEEKPAPSARLGDSCYFAKSKIVESLLRRGARVPLGRRTGPPLSEAEDGDSANRDELCKILGPKLGRALPMAAAAPPRGRPQYAAPRAEIASSASGGRQTTPPSSSAQRSPSARLFPHSRLVETGGRRHPPAARRNVRSAHLRCRWRRPVPLGTRHGPSGRETFSVRAPWEIISDKLIVYRFDFLLRRGARTHRVFCWPTGCNLHCPRAGGDWPKQLMLFGQSPTPAVARGSSYPDEQGLPYAGGGPYAGRAVPPGTRHWPFGRENILCPRAGGYWPKQLTLFDQYPTPAVARGCRSALESWSLLGNKLRLPSGRAGPY